MVWQTNEPAKSILEFGIGLPYSARIMKESFTSIHNIELTNLQPGTTYNYRVGSIDSSGNGISWSGNHTFTTQTTHVIVSLPESIIKSGDTLWLPLNTSEITNSSITSWAALIGFDPVFFRFVGIQQEQSLTSSWPTIPVESYAGIVSINAKANGNPAISSRGTKHKNT